MKRDNDIPLGLIKNQLCGANFKKLLSEKKITKWAIHRDCNISYRTLINWQKGMVKPNNYNARIVGEYLGLIPPEKAKIIELQQKQKELAHEIKRLSPTK